MKRILASFLVLIALYIFQTTVLNDLAIARVRPNVILLIVVYIGYRYGKIPGILMGFFTGLLIDLAEGSYVGYFALIYMLLGYFCGFTKKLYHKDYHLIPLILIGLSDFSLNFVIYITSFMVRNRLDFTYYLFRIILPELIYTMVISIFLYKGIDAIFKKVEVQKVEKKEEGKGGSVVD